MLNTKSSHSFTISISPPPAMADEFHTTANWWESPRTRFDTGTSSSSSSSALNSIASFSWPLDRSPVVSGNSSGVTDSPSVLTDTNLHMMELGLSSPTIDWNQSLLHGEKSETGFHSNSNYQQESGTGSSQLQWKENVFSGSSIESSMNDYKQINRGFPLDQSQFSPHSSSGHSNVTCQAIASNFQMDYGSPSSSSILQGLFRSDLHQPQQQSMNYSYNSAVNYGVNSNELIPSWSNKVPKQNPLHNQLQFSNNAPFWNASAAAMNDVRSGFFPSVETQFNTPTFIDKPKITQEPRKLVAKKSGSEPVSKRPRSESSSPLPAFKVPKVKTGDRITALQQLVSPFGKTDTASVLSEAIEYINFLHEQVTVLSTPYMKSGAGAPIQHHQNVDNCNKDLEGPKQDLRRRGLCLVPVSSTFPVTQETTVDFWTPTFGGTFR